ncbi:GNAT family N-acetyltransferase [Ectobacillus funiculus]|uniref:GNAT family N-acetyltransferase n=1 Tax=Ectobacillus funiculus TaxID=137993 RepID=UPI00101BD8AD|nr:GNAT family N-acetyltransferase [Ectobacillus funiculus]
MRIRDALKGELSYIQEQRINAYKEYAQVLPEGHWNALKQAIVSDTDTQAGVERLVAELDGKVVGSAVLFPAKTDAYDGLIDELDYPEIRMLAVTPEARGKGVAAALISECIQRAKSKGFRSIGLHTGEFMKNAIHLYEQFGFERLPQFDFQPAADGIIVRAYRLSFK